MQPIGIAERSVEIEQQGAALRGHRPACSVSLKRNRTAFGRFTAFTIDWGPLFDKRAALGQGTMVELSQRRFGGAEDGRGTADRLRFGDLDRRRSGRRISGLSIP